VRWEWSASSPDELHPEALPEADVSLSTHPAPLPRPGSFRLPGDQPVRLTLRWLLQPMLGALLMASQLLRLALHPADQPPIQRFPERRQRRSIELAILLQPAADHGMIVPGQAGQRAPDLQRNSLPGDGLPPRL